MRHYDVELVRGKIPDTLPLIKAEQVWTSRWKLAVVERIHQSIVEVLVIVFPGPQA